MLKKKKLRGVTQAVISLSHTVVLKNTCMNSLTHHTSLSTVPPLYLPLARVCPRDQVFSDCVSSCPPSCASQQLPGPAVAVGQCREECVGGCECPPGLYVHQGLCLKRDDCPCFHRRRTYQSGDRIQQRCNTW